MEESTLPEGSIWQELLDILLYVPLKLYELLTAALTATLNAIPVPDWVSNADNVLQGDSGFLFWLDLFNVPEGITIVLSAYGLRFLIRRIPIIG